MKKKFIALVAAVIICCYCSSAASASVFKDKIVHMNEFHSFDFQLQTSFGKLPQFSEDRMKQLNLFLQHLSFQGTVDSSRAQISVLLDNQPLFSYSESESAQQKQAIVAFKPDEFYILPSTVTEPTASIDKLQNDFDSFIRDIKKIDALDSLLSAVKIFSSAFPENIRITGIQPQSFRYYGRAVKKQTLSVSDEDMNAFMIEIGAAPQKNILDHRIPDNAYQHGKPDGFPGFFVVPPVEKTQQQDHHQFFAKRGEKRNHRHSAAQMRLQPFHQARFPGKGEHVSGQFHDKPPFCYSCGAPG